MLLLFILNFFFFFFFTIWYRRPFTEDMDWTVKEIRHYTFLENIRKKDEVSLRILENMPHVIPFKV